MARVTRRGDILRERRADHDAARCLECGLSFVGDSPDDCALHRRIHRERVRARVPVPIDPGLLAEIQGLARTLELPASRVVHVMLKACVGPLYLHPDLREALGREREC